MSSKFGQGGRGQKIHILCGHHIWKAHKKERLSIEARSPITLRYERVDDICAPLAVAAKSRLKWKGGERKGGWTSFIFASDTKEHLAKTGPDGSADAARRAGQFANFHRGIKSCNAVSAVPKARPGP